MQKHYNYFVTVCVDGKVIKLFMLFNIEREKKKMFLMKYAEAYTMRFVVAVFLLFIFIFSLVKTWLVGG